MTDALGAFVADTLAAPVPAAVRHVADLLATEAGAEAVLFYGSNLRTGSLDGVLDFYILTAGPRERGIWPRVGYREFAVGPATLRAKIATMTLATFAAAAAGRLIDTTIWTRFVQPAALAQIRSGAAAAIVVDAIAAAAVTASRFAAALGPAEGNPADYWRALFRQTYAAELRVEAPGREEQILTHGGNRYDTLLPLAWEAGGVPFVRDGSSLIARMPPGEAKRWRARWARRRRLGKPLNVVRLVRAAFTFDGAAKYGAWKIERHTGIAVSMTPWRERHPILAAPGVFWRVWRARR
ncbi:hypothetical protein [Sphingomonas sp. Leaf343]|uniref:hypothetical protein n=1 Tax=Sphingomonas sp. Leaf343 TaxID=1736345 RepID=UPI0006FC0E5E|nr:hypothetical protein [Sphingomonas sp. Leaf343]KQR87566.1 hypothetical protein ASG07_01250 [Sphingomonas sp. Leaf343]